MKTKKFALAAIALTTLSLVASPVFAEDSPPPPTENAPLDAKKAADFEKRGKEMFDKTDTDKDGFISKDEMAASQKERMDEMFNKTDTNSDGKLSPEELKAGREAMREKFKAKYKDNKRGGPVEEKKTTE